MIDPTCGNPNCTHTLCVEMRAEKKAKHDAAVKEVGDALTQVLKTSPQLLYEAALDVASHLAVDSITAAVTPSPDQTKKLARLRLSGFLAMNLAKLLLDTGQAAMTDDQIFNAVYFASRFNTK
jgi:hypothetical protein